MTSADVRESSAAADESDGEQLDPRRRLALLEECRDLVLAQLSRFIDEALDRLSIELTITAMKAAGRESQQALLDALSLVRMHRNDIEYRFRQSFAQLFEQRLFDRGPATPEAAASVPPGGLALVDESAMEDRLAIDRLVRRARRQLDPDEVLGVRARMAALLGRDWFDEDDYPASPEVVFEALQRSIDELEPATEVRTALLQAFEPHVATSLAGVHASVNERLRSQRVLPTIRPRPVVSADARRPDSTAAAQRPDSPAATAPGAQSVVLAAAVGPSGAVRDFALPGERLQRLHAFDDLVEQLSIDQEVARRSAARMLSDPDTFGMADLPMPMVRPPLIAALHALQSSSREREGAAPLVTELLDQARSKGSSLDQLTVEIVSLVFDYIYADRRLPDPVKQQLLRLQVVAVKAALLDRSFFARRQHPMRRLIDRVTDLATDPDADYGPESTLVSGVAGIVDWILGNFDDDLGVFDGAMARFDALAHAEGERRAARLLELTRQAERMEALAVAQEEASAEIALRIDPVTPAFVREFLYKWWSLALAHARISGECGGASWTQALQSAEMLIWSVAPKVPEDIPRLASLLPRMIGPMLSSLKAVGIADDERQRFFDELLRWHTRAIEDAKIGAGRSMPSAQSAIRIGDDGVARFDASVGEVLQGAARRHGAGQRPAENADVDALRRGDLIEFADEAGSTHTVSIAWISPTRKLFVLSRFPDFGRPLDRATLVSWFATGRASRVAPHSAVDSAIDAISQDDPVAAGGAQRLRASSGH
ncbi:MAG: DUF1631 domain-containing protein [Burkholderiaceae bacterium]|nr:DUF1631 domain-containing protein [Burkholderiaceae bacterium]